MVVWLTDSDTHPTNNGTDNDQPNDASNDGTSYNPSGRTKIYIKRNVYVYCYYIKETWRINEKGKGDIGNK